MSGPALRLSGISHAGARHAVMRWHYSRAMPAGKLVKLGVFEDGEFIGVIIFSRGANRHIADPYGLDAVQVCELARVALTAHAAPVSRIISAALRELRARCPGVRLVISYADSAPDRSRRDARAGGWTYTGAMRQSTLIVYGREVHKRTLYAGGAPPEGMLAWTRTHLDPHAEVSAGLAKHRYAYPLDRGARRLLLPLSLPYPPPLTAGRAEEGSTVTRRAPGAEMQVQPLPSAPPRAPR